MNWKEKDCDWIENDRRVLRPEGTLCFKWCAEQIKLGEVLPLAEPYKPLYGQKKGKGTFWLQFIKL